MPGGETAERIGRYTVQAVLGRGAMGVVYKAHDPVIDRAIAIKLVHADLLEGDDRTSYIARFQAEAQAAGRCSHPNVVAVFDFAMHGENPYLAMEFIDGVTLAKAARSQQPFSLPAVTDIVEQVLDGLDAAHALGVVHRDIKPANIMLAAQGRVKVTDFGISRMDSSLLTGTGAVVGTPGYMSPEQCRGAPVDACSDIFSVGVVLYELLTGQKPFTGPSQHEIWRKLLSEEPPDPAALRPDAPPFLLDALRRSLAKQPGDRFASARAMAAALRGGGMRPAAEPDRTVLATQNPPAPGPELDRNQLGSIERQLTAILGPIAATMVRRAARTAGSVDALCRTLEQGIEGEGRRDQFRREVRTILNGTGTGTGTGNRAAAAGACVLSDAELDAAQRALVRFVGPVAKLLVKRAAPGCGDAAALWHRLADHVDKPADRAAFLRQFPPP